jgi:NAD(P)-dependent dehydrogenase (short-subunit alcohol dehydrogenase family)
LLEADGGLEPPLQAARVTDIAMREPGTAMFCAPGETALPIAAPLFSLVAPGQFRPTDEARNPAATGNLSPMAGNCSNLSDMTGRTVVITGGNSGIGKATAEALARLGARVVITARDADRGLAAVTEISQASGNDDVECVPLDLSSLASVRSCATDLLDRLDEIHVLDLNAGGVLSRRTETGDGFETQFQANHLGHFLLSQLLLERLRRSAPARVVVVSSWGHTQARGGLDFNDLQWVARPYRGSFVYSATKLMNLYFTFELARRLADTGVTVNALHPGFVASGFAMNGDTHWLRLGIMVSRPFTRSPQKGAATAVWLAASDEVVGVTGKYFVDCKVKAPSPTALDTDAARHLFELSGELAGLG